MFAIFFNYCVVIVTIMLTQGQLWFSRNNRITAEGAVLIGKGLSLNETLLELKVSTDV